MRSNAGMANIEEDVDVALRACLRPQLTLWLGLASLGFATILLKFISGAETISNPSSCTKSKLMLQLRAYSERTVTAVCLTYQ